LQVATIIHPLLRPDAATSMKANFLQQSGHLKLSESAAYFFWLTSIFGMEETEHLTNIYDFRLWQLWLEQVLVLA
jgi:hypothetical protein